MGKNLGKWWHALSGEMSLETAGLPGVIRDAWVCYTKFSHLVIHYTALNSYHRCCWIQRKLDLLLQGFLGFFFSFLWDSCQDELYVLFLRAMSNVCVNL